MPRRQRRMIIDDVPKLLSEGRGQGEGENYRPWINVQNFSSYGQANRDLGATTGRQHDYFSRLEYRYCIDRGHGGHMFADMVDTLQRL